MPGDDHTAPGYGAAMAELEQILAELERGTVDVDRLGAQVKRASELIRFCRERVVAARLDIEQVVAQLDADHPG